MAKANCIIAEIGSTTTIVRAFQLHEEALYLGSGVAPTTIENSVIIGLKKALHQLSVDIEASYLMLATSSAAGGLKMTVHGLVPEMTLKAAKEATLNAGANLHFMTSGRMRESDVKKIKTIMPHIMVIAGGTDYGDEDVAWHNLLLVKDLGIPIIYAGNIKNHDKINALKEPVHIVPNVYPRVDDMRIQPLREAIYKVFEENIIHAKGMRAIKSMIKGHIIPTPGSVMDATLLAAEIFDTVITIDIGGATTDVHSVCPTSEAFAKFIEGEPIFKRTVEGDLGVYVSRHQVAQLFTPQECLPLYDSLPAFLKAVDQLPIIPTTKEEKEILRLLTKKCLFTALDRHIGDVRRIYTTQGMKVIPEGRDLSDIKTIIFTGGALLHVEKPLSLIQEYMKTRPFKLIPKGHVGVYLDSDYLMSSLGVLSLSEKKAARQIMNNMLKKEGIL